MLHSRGLAAACHFLQRDREHDLDVLAAGCAAPFKKAIEQTAARAEPEIESNSASAEDLVEIDPAKQILRRVAHHSREAAAVILRALFRIGQDGVGRGDFLELLLRVRLPVAVGMILQRELAEGVLDLLFIRIARHAEDFVEIALGGRRHAEKSPLLREQTRRAGQCHQSSEDGGDDVSVEMKSRDHVVCLVGGQFPDFFREGREQQVKVRGIHN